jgi:hypothetical protein
MTEPEIEVDGFTNEKPKNVLTRGRYEGKCVKITPYKDKNTQDSFLVVETLADGLVLTDYVMTSPSDESATKDKTRRFKLYKGHSFLFACGIRNNNRKFSFSSNLCIDKIYLIDVSEKSDGSGNWVNGYSPIEEETAPMTDVPAENLPVGQEEPKKEEKKSELDDL